MGLPLHAPRQGASNRPGPIAIVALTEAREEALKCRRLLFDVQDPLAERRFKAIKANGRNSFRQVASLYVAAHEAAWRNPKHRQQWKNTIAQYVIPRFGDLPIDEISTGDILAALEPIWREKPETAGRVRGRIEAILDYAKARGWREGGNPARWRGHLDQLLPKRSKVAPVRHHSALPWGEVTSFYVELAQQDGVAARALEFLILTAARTGEVIGAKWEEIDFTNNAWVIPKARMKGGEEHRVPLSAMAKTLLRRVQEINGAQSGFIFPGSRKDKPLSNMAMTMCLRRMKREDITVHGFRSTFRDWCAEATQYPREVAEQALAHSLGNKVEAAYRRGDLFEKRRGLMSDWSAFCGGS